MKKAVAVASALGGLTVCAGFWLSSLRAPSDTPAGIDETSQRAAKNRKNELLTVEETVGAAFLRSDHGSPWNVLKLANPSAKGAIYRILENKELIEYHPTALYLLGYIGDGSDARKVEAICNSHLGIVTHAQENIVYGTFISLGLMSRRGILEATKTLDRMADIAYWRPVKFRIHVNAPMPPEYVTLASVISIGLSRAESKNLERKVQQILAQIEDEKLKFEMAWRIDPKSLKDIPAEMRAIEAMPLEPGLRKLLLARFNGDLQNPAPRELPPNFRLVDEPGEQRPKVDQRPEVLRRDVVERLSKEAVAAYEKLRDEIASGEFDPSKTAACLLDDGRLLTPKDVQRNLDEYQSSLATERSLLESLAKMQPVPVEFRGERITESGKVPGADRDVIVFSFKLAGTEQLGRQVRANHRAKLTVADDGRLVVYLKKVDSKWYWNPFGW